MADNFNRPMFRKISRKLALVQDWCKANAVDPAKIITVQLHPVYGFGQGNTNYAVQWED